MNPVLATPLAMANLLASGAKRKDDEEAGQPEALQDGALEALSEEDLSISGSSARRMVMRKLLRKQEVSGYRSSPCWGRTEITDEFCAQ